ncbi:MAG TPA: alpha/beta hydrolase-fold protein [Pseudonocardiaceae bacterium]|nr:alpha/beta hydrolase-fold protein [Pseudonocardiaceae bacterium]
MSLTRRGLILGALGAIVVAGGAGEYFEVLPGGVQLHRLLGLTGGAGSVPDVPAAHTTVRQFDSAARGRTVDVVTMIPAGADPARLPVCLVLHGRNNNAQGMITLGLPHFLSTAAPRFAMVAVDGGDSYWVPRTPADDPQRMLTDELPGWLTTLGLAATPSTVLAISMGCFGALVYARSKPVRRLALLSPALFQNWAGAQTVHAFADETQWAQYEPLRHPAPTNLAIWCGREDPFYPAAHQLAEQARPAIASFPHGQHDDDFWRRMLPLALPYLAGGGAA